MTISYLINPFAKTISQMDAAVDELEEVYRLSNCELFDLVPFVGYGDHVYADDEGFFVPVARQAYFAFLADDGKRLMLAGSCLVVGHDKTGNVSAPKASIYEVYGRVSWPDRNDAENYADRLFLS
jgi:hypothetical protein